MMFPSGNKIGWNTLLVFLISAESSWFIIRNKAFRRDEQNEFSQKELPPMRMESGLLVFYFWDIPN